MEKKTTLLLVEDDVAMRDLITLALSQRMDLQVVPAGDGVEALELYQNYKPKYVILDILMPQMNGLQFLKRLKEQGALEQTTVIVISALGYEEVVQQAVEAGARDFIVKPFDVRDMLQRVMDIMGETEGGKQAADG